MSLAHRGTIYRLQGGSAHLFGVLVLSNNVWNRRMGTVGVVPVRAPVSADSVWEPIFSSAPALQARVGYLASLSRERLLEARFVLAPDQLAPVEQGLTDLLALADLQRTPPETPSAPNGSVTYPKWSEIYYAGPVINGQRKRYIVVSRDHWNAAGGVAIGVRTTSQDKTWGAAFPRIESGAARACRGDATVFPMAGYDLEGRLNPASLEVSDMVSVARGIADVFDLT